MSVDVNDALVANPVSVAAVAAVVAAVGVAAAGAVAAAVAAAVADEDVAAGYADADGNLLAIATVCVDETMMLVAALVDDSADGWEYI